MSEFIQFIAGGKMLGAERTAEGLELNIEGETVAVLEYDEESKVYKLYAYGEGDEPEFMHEFRR